MTEIRICTICESSCSDEHGYEVSRNKFLYLCNNCWKVIHCLVYENLKDKPEIYKSDESLTEVIEEPREVKLTSTTEVNVSDRQHRRTKSK
jgi:hypothetical protein